MIVKLALPIWGVTTADEFCDVVLSPNIDLIAASLPEQELYQALHVEIIFNCAWMALGKNQGFIAGKVPIFTFKANHQRLAPFHCLCPVSAV